jgi:predicted GNAT family N-acyltransferase
MTVTVRRVRAEDGRADALAVRREVFIEEQGVPEDLEVDGRDDEAVHFVACDDGDPVGAARLRGKSGDSVSNASTGKVERVAVVADRRGEGLGRQIMAELETTAAEEGIETLVLHAQLHVEGFYRELDYETTSDVFEEAGIDHVEMRKEL